MASYIAIVVATIFGMIVSSFVGYYVCQWRKATIKARQENRAYKDSHEESGAHELDLPIFDLLTIYDATDKFSIKNKIGQGGFGPVYKGELPNGQKIAVKRLSQSSEQGVDEFKNEVVLFAQLQHRNLVRLLGCCTQGQERMLIYEFLSNKSLDHFIFDPMKKKLLTWKNHFNIIVGIARGLLYLHEDSRLRIIHRDLKASNILLDNEMYPKISDFGIARIFGGDQIEHMTNRVIGTYGYMSPEYAMSGHFSVKSDVFSFGVLVLEIISGRRNWGFKHPEHNLNLVGYAWKLWNEETPLKLTDQVLFENTLQENEITRCIQVGLLCLQQNLDDRPTMSQAVFMLSNESTSIQEPREPGFCVENCSVRIESSLSRQTTRSVNEVTITEVCGR